MASFQGSGIVQAYENELLDWRTQLAAASGGSVFLTDDQLVKLGSSGKGPQSFKDFSQQIWDSGSIPNETRAQMPWLGLGLASDFGSGEKAWTQLSSQYSSAWHEMTGQWMNPVFDADRSKSTFGKDDFAKIYQAAQNNWSAAEFSAHHKEDPAFQAQNPWVKHGMTKEAYDQYRLESGAQMRAVASKLLGAAPDDLVNAHLDKFESPSDLENFLKTDQATLDTHAWLKYGMDFQSFKMRKADLAPQFGGHISDEQAINQIANAHQVASGSTIKEQTANAKPFKAATTAVR